MAGAILTEQRLTSELAHELRTPLAAIQGTAELMSMREQLDDDLRRDIESILAKTHAMAATITTLLELWRAEPGSGLGEAPVSDLVRRAVDESGTGYCSVIAELPDVSVAVPASVAVRALAPVIENAARFGRTVWISAEHDGAVITVVVADDGPGLGYADREEVFTAGYSGTGGSGLGLALARRMARSVGGDVMARHEAFQQGARFEISLPAAGGNARALVTPGP